MKNQTDKFIGAMQSNLRHNNRKIKAIEKTIARHQHLIQQAGTVIKHLQQDNASIEKSINKAREDEQRRKRAFDDELMHNFDTVDVLVTDTTHTPQMNHFCEIVASNIDVEYNPRAEQKKYDYAIIEKMRKTR